MNKKIEFLLDLLNDELRAISEKEDVDSFVIVRSSTEFRHRSENGIPFDDDAFFQDSDLYKNIQAEHPWEIL